MGYEDFLGWKKEKRLKEVIKFLKDTKLKRVNEAAEKSIQDADKELKYINTDEGKRWLVKQTEKKLAFLQAQRKRDGVEKFTPLTAGGVTAGLSKTIAFNQKAKTKFEVKMYTKYLKRKKKEFQKVRSQEKKKVKTEITKLE